MSDSENKHLDDESVRNQDIKQVEEIKDNIATENFEPLQEVRNAIVGMPKIAISTEALQKIVNNQKIICVPAFETLKQTLADFSKMCIDLNRSALITGINNILRNDELDNTIRKIVDNYNNAISQTIKSSAFQWLKNIDFTPIAESLKKIVDIDFNKLKEIYLLEMYEAHWFPYASWNADFGLTSDIFEIISKTRKSKNRIKRIDRAVFTYYTKEKIEKTKKNWRTLGLPEHQMRILHQAVQAYHRKEYALTVIVLTTQWEGIIYNKAHDSRRKITSRTKDHVAKLVQQNDYAEIFKSYYDDFIMYQCNSVEESIDDVPGRHSAAHNFYGKYPTRKAALNAILFTDFLLNLEPLEEE